MVILLIAVIMLLAAVLIILIIFKTTTQTNQPVGLKEVKTLQSQKEQSAPPPTYTFPGGGQELLPQYRLVALYGTPSSTRMGALGEQPLAEAITRVKGLASEYQAYSSEPVYPAFEIITTVASATPTPDSNYSRELPIEELQPWVTAAKEAGVYIVLDLQPGRTDFLSQAKQYEPLLKEPHVGLALDPEWRLQPDQVHLKQIGSVAAGEVNAVSSWLADLVKQGRLPQKLLLLHQFRLSMIANREQLDTSRKELAYVIQMDGNGAQHTKLGTWQAIRAQPPANVLFGWKNFYDEDQPVLTPAATMQLDPKPWFVSYQ